MVAIPGFMQWYVHKKSGDRVMIVTERPVAPDHPAIKEASIWKGPRPAKSDLAVRFAVHQHDDASDRHFATSLRNFAREFEPIERQVIR